MSALDTAPLLDAGSALRKAIMSAYNEAASAPGAEDLYRTMEYSKGRDHVDLGLLRGKIGEPAPTLEKLTAFQRVIASMLEDPVLEVCKRTATNVLLTGSPLRARYDKFMRHMWDAYQPTAEGNQYAVGLVRDLSTLTVAALVLKTLYKVSFTGQWASSMHDALDRWERSLQSTTRRLFASTAREVTASIDVIADDLQARGMLRLAYDLDVVSDILEGA